jgi:hypothetical protein
MEGTAAAKERGVYAKNGERKSTLDADNGDRSVSAAISHTGETGRLPKRRVSKIFKRLRPLSGLLRAI